MPRTYVTDITDFLDDEGELVTEMPKPARQLASFLVLIIDAVTQAVPAHDHDTRIRCGKKACMGSIRASLRPTQEEIAWYCPDCRSKGVIRNWQGTKWNQLRQESGVD
jgi:hypothetical protein